jgi:hypothetical protein
LHSAATARGKNLSLLNLNYIDATIMKLFEITGVLDATPLVKVNDDQLNKEILTGGSSDLMSDILAKISEGCVLLTGLTNIQVVRTAMISGIGAVIFVRGKTPPEDVVELAESESIPLFTSPYSMFVSCGRLYTKGITGLDGAR